MKTNDPLHDNYVKPLNEYTENQFKAKFERSDYKNSIKHVSFRSWKIDFR
jgi:hypothetical protein